MAEKFIDDACTILAIQQLIEDEAWQPREVVEHVIQHHGLRNDSFDLIEQHAPVISHNESEVGAYEDGSLLISSENGEFELEADERLVISYETSSGRGHSECIQASDFDQYASEHTIKHIFTR